MAANKRLKQIKFSDVVQATFRAVSKVYYREIIIATPGSGTVADTWEIDIIDNVVTIYNEEWGDVVKFIEDGTQGPYEIKPKDKKALRWSVGGGYAFAKKVTHPGIKARKFIKRVLDDKALQSKFDTVLEEEIQKLFFKANLL